MKERFNVKTISKNVQSLKKKLKKTKSQRSIDHPTSEKDNYLKNIYNDPDLVDYREPEWDGVDHLPTRSNEDNDDSGEEESEASNGGNMDDNDPSDNKMNLHYLRKNLKGYQDIIESEKDN